MSEKNWTRVIVGIMSVLLFFGLVDFSGDYRPGLIVMPMIAWTVEFWYSIEYTSYYSPYRRYGNSEELTESISTRAVLREVSWVWSIILVVFLLISRDHLS